MLILGTISSDFRCKDYIYEKLYVNFVMISYIVTGISGLGKVLHRFYPFLSKEHTIIKKIFSLNFIKISYRLADIFDI